MLRFWLTFLAVLALSAPERSAAEEVRIAPEKVESSFTLNGRTFTIGRIQDQDHFLTDYFARTSRPCPPFCIQPMGVAEGVATIGELELIGFLEEVAAAEHGLLIDSRLPEWFARGAIPGAVNVPFSTLDPENPYRDDILRALGATGPSGALDFSGALELTLYSNGAWSGQAPAAIRHLIASGYPPEKLRYYRGGVQAWAQLGLTLVDPQTPG